MAALRSVHDYAGRLERALARIEASGLAPEARRALLDFSSACRALGRGPARTLRYVTDLHRIADGLGPAFLGPTKGRRREVPREGRGRGHRPGHEGRGPEDDQGVLQVV